MNKAAFVFSIMLLLSMMLNACVSERIAKSSLNNLQGYAGEIWGEWHIEGGGTLTIEAQHYRASGGCNSLFGQLTKKGKNLIFSTPISTKKACFPETLMQGDNKVAKALIQVRSYRILNRGKAELLNIDNDLILTIIKSPQ